MVRLSEEIPHYRVDNGRKTNCIVRAVQTCHFEHALTIRDYKPNHVLHSEQLERWDIGVANLYRGEVEIYTMDPCESVTVLYLEFDTAGIT